MSATLYEKGLEKSDIFSSLLEAKPHVVKQRAFQAVTGLEHRDLDAIYLGQTEIPANLSAKQILSGIRMLLGLRSKEAAELLGVSESGISRGRVRPSRG